MSEPASHPDGCCWDCGYLLRGVDSGRCPECGRAFDRGEPATINLGRPMGRAARFLARPIGPAPGLLAFAGAGLVLATTGWPVKGWDFSPRDLGYYGDLRAWGTRAPMTWTDLAYMSGLALAAAAVAWLAARFVGRAIAIRRYSVPRARRGTMWRPALAATIVSSMTLAGVVGGWPYRLGQRWLAEFRVRSAASPSLLLPPLPIAGEAKRALLRSAISQGRTPRDRLWGVKAVVELNYEYNLIAQAVPAERDRGVKIWEMRLSGLCRNEAAGPMLLGLLGDADPEIRAAAADALGAIHHVFERGRPDVAVAARSLPTSHTDSDPPIDRPVMWDTGLGRVLPTGTREALVRAMTGGSTTAEREAAARALLFWPPPDYRFRLAEWGVFRVDITGRTEFMDAQLAQVPPFVHRVGDPAESFVGRLMERAGYFAVCKPVIHLTADAPLAVAIDVTLDRGRPLVAYPKPDDFIIAPNVTLEQYQEGMRAQLIDLNTMRDQPEPPPRSSDGLLDRRPLDPIATFDPNQLPSLDDPGEGYPWLRPRHEPAIYYRIPKPGGSVATTKPTVADIGGIGLTWQSIIVSPTKLPWMRDADVGLSPQFAWWNRLRKVDCSYVSSRGESERFLYYDGAARGLAPLRSYAYGDTLVWEDTRLNPDDSDTGSPELPPASRAIMIPQSIYVECDERGGVRAIPLNRFEDPQRLRHRLRIADVPRIDARAAEEWLARALQIHGLKASEAAGLIDVWRRDLFETPGRRTLVVASGPDYDVVCPIAVEPRPTELARVALFWTELSR